MTRDRTIPALKRLLVALGAILLLGGSLPGGDVAFAQERRGWERGHHDGGRWEGRGGPRERGWERRTDPQGARWEDRGYRRRDYGDRYPGRDYGERYPRRDYGPAAREYGGPRDRYVRPDAPVIRDYPRYRLRTPPRGFVWMRMGGGYGLVDMSTGQVFDVVPY